MVSPRVGELLSKFEGHQEAADAVAAESLGNTAGMPRPSPSEGAATSSLQHVEETLRYGTDEDRAALLRQFNAPDTSRYPVEPGQLNRSLIDIFSMDAPAVDKRIEELQYEIPSVDVNKPGWLAASWGKVRDVGGSVIGTALEGLDLPAEGLERLVGMAYYNEIPLADRWHVAASTYDTIWADVFAGGDMGKEDLVRDYHLGRDLDEMEQEYDNPWASGLGHFVLDPLWLFGGVPLVSKALPASARGGTLARVLDRGVVDLSKVPGVRRVPVLGRVGANLEEGRILRAVEMSDNPVYAAKPIQQRTGWRRLIEKSPQYKTDDDLNSFTAVVTQFTDPRAWEERSTEGTYVRGVLEAMGGRQPTPSGGLGSLFETSEPVKNVRRMLEQNGQLAQTIRGFSSLKRINHTDPFWRDAPEMLKTVDAAGNTTTIDAMLRAGQRLTPQQSARYAQYRTAKLHGEFMTRGVPALAEQYGLQQPRWIQQVDKMSASMKTWMSLAVLNNPRFVALNWANNAFHIGMKGEDLRGAWRQTYAVSPFKARPGLQPHKLAGYQRQLLDDLGFGEELAQQIATDVSMHEEFLPHLGEGRLRNFLRNHEDKIAFNIRAANNLDTGMRQTATVEGIKRANAAVWTVGDHGVLPPIPHELETIPGFVDDLMGLSQRGFDALENLKAAYTPASINGQMVINPAQSVSGGSLLNSWATNQWRAQFPGLVPTSTNNASLFASEMPGHLIEQVDDILEWSRQARRNGSSTWIEDMHSAFDDLADGVDLDAYMAQLQDGRLPPSIPMNIRPNRAMPWQDIAHFERSHRTRSEMLSRIVARHGHDFSNGRAAQTVLKRAAGAQERMRQGIYRLMDEMFTTPADAEGLRRLTQFRDDALKLFDERDRSSFTLLFENHPSMAEEVTAFFKADRDQFLRAWSERVAGLREGSGGLEDAIRRMHIADNDFHEQLARRFNLDMPRQYSLPEYPTQAGLHASTGQYAHSYIRHAKSQSLSRLQTAGGVTQTVNLPHPLTQVLDDYMEEVRTAMRQRNMIATINGRAQRDFVALNYAQKRGIDSFMQLAFPYWFWPSRTMRDWAKMTAARPGVTSALTGLYGSIQDINEDAGLPDRLKTNIRIPVPFLEDMLPFGGPEGSMYFDPIRVLYPLSTFTDHQEFTQEGMNSLGQSYDFAANLGVGINPFSTLGLGATGILGDRDDWVRRGLASWSSGPFGVPAPRQIRAVHDWLSGVTPTADNDIIPEDVRAAIAEGEAAPEGWLKSSLRTIWDLASTDGWDGYRTDRMVANLVAQDPERWSARQGLEALREKRGALYEEARKQAGRERGLQVITGWALMPLRVYPEGEQVQRGLDAMWREVRDTGDSEQIDKFFEQYPEFQVRKISTVNREDGSQLAELDTTMFYIDVNEVEAKYGPMIDELRETVFQAEQQGYLETKDGRRLIEVIKSDISYLVQRQEQEIDQLKGLYSTRATGLSLRAAPRERALFELRDQYYSIERSDYDSADAWYAARDQFIRDLPAARRPDGEWLSSAVTAAATYAAAGERIAAADPDERGQYIDRRDQLLEGMTQQAMGQVSREEFEAYLNQSARPKSAERIEYEKAAQEIQSYFAIAEADGLSPASQRAYQREYWSSHPLLEKYYGNSEPDAWNAESAAAFGEMDTIWNGYYDREDDLMAQRQYLASKIERLNELRQQVGQLPIELIDWQAVLNGQFQQDPTTPAERALQQQLRSGDNG